MICSAVVRNPLLTELSRNILVANREQHDGCSVEKGACGVDGGLEVFCQSPISPNPGKEPVDYRAPRG